MALFDFTSQISQPLNNAKANLSSTVSGYTGKLSEVKGKVGSLTGAGQGATHGIRDAVKQGEAGFEDFQVMIGLKDLTEEFIKAKEKVQSVPKVPLDPTADKYKADLPKAKEGSKNLLDAKTYLLNHGISRTNRFRIEFIVPPLFENDDWLFEKGNLHSKPSSLGQITSEELGIAIESLTVPGLQFDTQLASYGGYKTQVATGYTVDDVSMVLRCYGDMAQKAFFDRWANSIYNFKTGSVRFFNKYATDIYIYQLDELNRDVYCVMLKGAYPKMASALDLNSAAQSDYHRLSLQWSIEKMIPIEVQSPHSPKAFGTKNIESKAPPKTIPTLSKSDQFIKDKFGDRVLEYKNSAGSYLGL